MDDGLDRRGANERGYNRCGSEKDHIRRQVNSVFGLTRTQGLHSKHDHRSGAGRLRNSGRGRDSLRLVVCQRGTDKGARIYSKVIGGAKNNSGDEQDGLDRVGFIKVFGHKKET